MKLTQTPVAYTWTLLFTLLFVCISCQNSNPPSMLADSIGEETGSNKLKAGAIYQLSYIQTTFSYSTPSFSNPSKEKRSVGNTLQRYEKVKETILIDNRGFISIEKDWLDGSAGMNMPSELYARAAAVAPQKDRRKKPVVRSVMSNGTIRFYSSDGNVVETIAYNRKHFKVDPVSFRRNLKSQQSEQGIKNALQGLEHRQVVFHAASPHFATLTRPVFRNGQQMEQKEIMDLRLGRIVRSFDILPNGKISQRAVMNYERAAGQPILEQKVTEILGEFIGNWIVKSRTLVNRDQIEVIIR